MSDLDRYQYGYDQNSNRLYKANVVGTPVVTGGLDEYYSYDNLNRLIQMQRGTLNSTNTGITGTPSREMDYTLDPTGNWSAYLTKTAGTTDLNQTRTSNTVNEITAIGSTLAWATPPVYDKAGNMTSFPQPATPGSAYTATYDAWNRMMSVSSGGSSVATYQYDGLGRRIVKVTSGTGGQTRDYYYTNKWQDIEERLRTSGATDKQYVWGVRYVDELVCRDDADNPTTPRLYAMQDANFNLTSVCDTTGTVQERYLFDPYGNRTIMNGSWANIASSAYSWVIGHQGLMLDAESGLVYNRSRYIQPIIGRFLQRDSVGYRASVDLYEYCRSSPILRVDPLGTTCTDGCPGSYVTFGPIDVKDDKSGATLVNSMESQLQSELSSIVGDALPEIKGLNALISLAQSGWNQQFEEVFFVGFAVPCKCGVPQKSGLISTNMEATPKGPASNNTGGYDRLNSTKAEWKKSMDIAQNDWAGHFNQWLKMSFPNCATISNSYIK